MCEPYATVQVVCRDGKVRAFRVDVEGECPYYQGRKHTYIICDEFERRGLVTMVPAWDNDGDRSFILAPSRFQPVRVEATTRVGKWKWEVGDE